TPHIIPPLYAFNRTNVYLLMSQQSSSLTPKSVVLRGVSRHGPLEIEIPIQILDTPGETIHQLAAKSAIAELEQGRGWITQLKDESDGQLFREKYESRFPDMVEREAVRLGVQFQVGGKWCSFVATETRKEKDDDATMNEIGVEMEDKDMESREIVIVKETKKAAGSRFSALPMLCGASPVSRTLGSPLPSSRAAMRHSGSVRSPQFGASPMPMRAGPMVSSRKRGSLISNYGISDDNSSESSESGDQADAMDCSTVGSSQTTASSKRKSLSQSRCAPSSDRGISTASRGTGSLKALSATIARGAESTVHGIVDLQTFEGYWEWQESLLSCVGVDPVLAAEAVKKHGWDLRVAATALAIAFLEKKKIDEKDAWELVVEKAKGWMEEQIGANEVVVVLHKASELVQ
ncbi:hypothetical protein BGX34_005246, partial [Mortierella sp. NVP85]